MSAQPAPRITEQQYLEAERAAEFKSEFYDGQMWAMSGGSFVHGNVGANIIGALVQALRGRPGRVVSSDVRVRASSGGLYTYPDATVICGEPRFADDQKDTVLNPTAIIEVLSESTEAYDRGLKFAQYRKIESLREYVLVSQTEPRVEKFFRQPGEPWVLSESEGLDGICRLESLDCTIALSDIYDKVPLAAEET